MSIGNWKFVSLCAILLGLACCASPSEEAEVKKAAGGVVSLDTSAQSPSIVEDMDTETTSDTIIDSVRNTNPALSEQEMRNKKKLEYQGRFTPQQWDSMRRGEMRLPPRPLSPEKQHFLDSIQKLGKAGKFDH